MNKQDVKLAKEKILKCLTEDFEYGRTRKGKTMKRRRKNRAIFNPRFGHGIFNGIDLTMVMDKVILGLYFAMEESNKIPDSDRLTQNQ